MMQIYAESSYTFRLPSEKQGGEKLKSLVNEKSKEKALDDGEFIFCRQCIHAITSKAERVQVNGSHQHTFANSHGIVFQIGCFGSANGCGHVGSATDEFTWFAGYNWRVVVCSLCLTHLGWVFSSGSGESFHGLILDHLIIPE